MRGSQVTFTLVQVRPIADNVEDAALLNVGNR
jgi:hypothetical protein